MTLQDRIAHWTAAGYRVTSQTPTSAQLVRPKHFNTAEFLTMPLYLIEYLGQREQQVYLVDNGAGGVTETGSGTQVSAYRRAQGLSAPMRLFWVIVPFVVIAVLALTWQAVQ